MPDNLLDHAYVALAALVAVVVATPVVRRLARVVGAVDVPRSRHIHTRPTPSIGGLAILAGFVVALAVGSRLETFDAVYRTTSEPEAIVLAGLVIVYVGLVDDLKGLSAPAKIAGQLLAAGTLVLFGVTFRFAYIPGSPGAIVALSPDFAAVATVLAIVAMINAVNLVDGLDGLAAGIVTIAAASLLGYVLLAEPATVPVEFAVSSASLVLAALIGGCLGFLVYNFHPASIFMGDTGSMFIGLLLGAAGVSAIGNTVQPTSTDFLAVSVPALIPALVLAVPFIDTILAILRRLRSGQAISAPDKKHLHHRLIALGHSHRRAVLVMYFWSAVLAFAVVGGLLLEQGAVLIITAVGIVIGLAVTLAGWLRRSWSRVADGDAIVYSFTSAQEERDYSRLDAERHGHSTD